MGTKRSRRTTLSTTTGIKLSPYNVLSHDVGKDQPIVGAFGRPDPMCSMIGEKVATQWSSPIWCAGGANYFFVHPKELIPLVLPGMSPTYDMAQQMQTFVQPQQGAPAPPQGAAGAGNSTSQHSTSQHSTSQHSTSQHHTSQHSTSQSQQQGVDQSGSVAWVKALHLPEVYSRVLGNKVGEVNATPRAFTAKQMEKIGERFSTWLCLMTPFIL